MLKFLPPENEWPLRLARPIKQCSEHVSMKMQQLIQNVVDTTEIPKEVLLRKKWMNALYQHVVFHGDEQDLPEYLLGWRYQRLTQPLIQILREDEDFLMNQMQVAR